jgi:hypothetical protein
MSGRTSLAARAKQEAVQKAQQRMRTVTHGT